MCCFLKIHRTEKKREIKLRNVENLKSAKLL